MSCLLVQGRRWASGNNALNRYLIGGWEIDAILVLQSGLPFTVLAPSATNNGTTSRANGVAGVSPYPGDRSLQQWFNPAAFSVPPAACYCYGNFRTRCADRAAFRQSGPDSGKTIPHHREHESRVSRRVLQCAEPSSIRNSRKHDHRQQRRGFHYIDSQNLKANSTCIAARILSIMPNNTNGKP